MPDITVEIEIYCAKCGAGICRNGTERGGRGYRSIPAFEIEPCEKCMSDAEEEGRQKGYEEGVIDTEDKYQEAEG